MLTSGGWRRYAAYPPYALIEFAGIGHAPMLMAGDQIAAVRDFLLQA